ncbi:MAG: DUF4097 domain-containing protein [Provencibacterium sp.]|jgi:hypothetical protein|nr:DUF4097 domain-containing protein [Provencibacterium sp.]
MNGFLKGCLAAGVGLIAIGSVVTAFDYARTLRNAPRTAAEGLASVLEESREGLKNLDLNLSGADLEITAGETLSLQVGEKLQPYFQYELKGDTLRCWDTLGKNWWRKRSLGEGYDVSLVLPKAVYETVTVQLGVGSGELRGLETEIFSAASGAGEIQLWDIRAEETELSCGAGTFTGRRVYSSRRTEINCGVGEFDLSGDLRGNVLVSGGVGEARLRLAGAEEEYSVLAEAGIGSVQVGSRETSMMGGKLEMERENAENRLELLCGVGQIDVQFSEDIDQDF